MAKYFKNITTLDELKKEFRRLAMLHHPDRGGDTETMKQINVEYDMLFPVLKAAYNKAASKPTTETAASTRSEFYTANGWKGDNYDSNLTLKEIAQRVRAFIKEFYPTYKFSVRTEYASMCQELIVEMKESPIRIYKSYDELTEKDKDELTTKMIRNRVFTLTSWDEAEQKAEFERIWNGAGGHYYKALTDATSAAAKAVDDYVNSFNRDDSDSMIDYFDVNFYYFGCLRENGKNVKIVPKTARIAPKKEETKSEDKPAAVRVEINQEFNGIEVYFNNKPDSETREALKADGWRWHSKKYCWYNKNTESHLQNLRGILEGPQRLSGATA